MHISQLRDERVETVADAVREGEYVWVVVTDIKEGNKVSLSMRLVDQETGALKEPLNDVDAAAPASAQIKFCDASQHDLHAIDATPARSRGVVAAFSPRKDSVHPTH